MGEPLKAPAVRTPFAFILLWIVLGISMILFNKALFSTWGFAYPFFLTFWHCLFCTITTQLMVHLNFSYGKELGLLSSARDGLVTAQIFRTRILPLSFFFAAGLTLGNSAYKFLSVAYIQMLKSLSPVLLLLLAFAVGKEKPSAVQLVLVLIICFGVMLASAGELHFSLVGATLQILAIFSDVSRMTLIDVLMVDFRLDSLSMLYYLAPPSTVLILLGFLVFEYDPNTFPWERIAEPQFGGLLVLNGVLAFALNIAVFVAVAHTSSVIIGVSGLIKDMLLVVSSVLFFASPISAQQVVGYGISVAGLFLYREYKSDPAAWTERALGVLVRAKALLAGASSSLKGRGEGRGEGREDAQGLLLGVVGGGGAEKD